ERDRHAPDADIPRRSQRQPAGIRASPPDADRSALSRSLAVLRILPRRYRPWSRGLAPDRLDRSGRKAADAALFPYRAPILTPSSSPHHEPRHPLRPSAGTGAAALSAAEAPPGSEGARDGRELRDRARHRDVTG